MSESFEEWYTTYDLNTKQTRTIAKLAWDAAIASTKPKPVAPKFLQGEVVQSVYKTSNVIRYKVIYCYTDGTMKIQSIDAVVGQIIVLDPVEQNDYFFDQDYYNEIIKLENEKRTKAEAEMAKANNAILRKGLNK